MAVLGGSEHILGTQSDTVGTSIDGVNATIRYVKILLGCPVGETNKIRF